MTTPSKRLSASADNCGKVFALKGPGPENQFVQLRPTLRKRELAVLSAVSELPTASRTPAAAATALVRQGIDIPYSSLAAILRRLERKGAIRLERKRG